MSKVINIKDYEHLRKSSLVEENDLDNVVDFNQYRQGKQDPYGVMPVIFYGFDGSGAFSREQMDEMLAQFEEIAKDFDL